MMFGFNNISIDKKSRFSFPAKYRDAFINSNENADPASVELELKKDDIYSIYYWDGYSLADTYQTKDYSSAIKHYKKYAKKLAKNLRRY